jgi:hypothetical protein
MQDVHDCIYGVEGAGECPDVDGIYREVTPLSLLPASDAVTDVTYDTGQTDRKTPLVFRIY